MFETSIYYYDTFRKVVHDTVKLVSHGIAIDRGNDLKLTI